ncbi:MAG: M36 family metallopeptidase [Pseudomarimonas sp.]
MTRSMPIRCAASLLALAISTSLFAAEPALNLAPAQAGQPVEIAQRYYREHAADYGLSSLDIEHRLSDSVFTKHNGLTHVYLQQTIDGIPVDGAVSTINVRADGGILSLADTFVAAAKARANSPIPALGADVALSVAAGYLNIRLPAAPQVVGGKGGAERHTIYSSAALSAAEIPASLLYVKVDDKLRLTWNLVIDRMAGESFFGEMRIDAETGDLVDIASYVAHSDQTQARPKGETLGYSASYRVVPFPFESPTHPGAAFANVVDPHRADASPRGWQDSRALGSTGFEFADTSGNNVVARADLMSTNSASNFRAPATVNGTTLTFAHVFDPNAQPSTGNNMPAMGNTPAALVNLFYWNNILHDVLWAYGFDEPAGNFQVNNFARGGLGNDGVNADALDGTELPTPNTNNANFGTPADGGAPRMQMFRWLGPMGVQVTAPYQATYEAFRAGFGAPVNAPFPGNFVQVNDGGPNGGREACLPLINAAQIAGNIAVIRRGTCEFGSKALRAQQAGATGVVLFNNQGGDTLLSPGAGADGGQVTIPVTLISENNGNVLSAALANGPGAGSLLPPTSVGADRDSDFDAGIIAHEYGHGVSNRLTGGPSQATCLNNEEQGGEGWSDYIGLMMTLNGTDCAAPRGTGTYASFQAPTGPGIRRFPYSTNRAINPFTFRDVADPAQSVPHGVGSVWATTIWDMTCDLIQTRGFDPDRVTGNGGNNIAFQLVLDGMKLQPCRPTMVQARDAIIAADVANNAAAERCTIWRAFGRRGMGLSATSGLNTSRSDQVEAFDVPADCAQFTVTSATQGAGTGTVAPAVPQAVAGQTLLPFTFTPTGQSRLTSVTGCGGTLAGTRYTTAAVTTNCTVTATFEVAVPEIFANGFGN